MGGTKLECAEVELKHFFIFIIFVFTVGFIKVIYLLIHYIQNKYI